MFLVQILVCYTCATTTKHCDWKWLEEPIGESSGRASDTLKRPNRPLNDAMNGSLLPNSAFRAETPAELLSVLANTVAVAAFLGVILLALFGGYIRMVLIASKKARSLYRSRAHSDQNLIEWWRLQIACLRRVRQLSRDASSWSVARELEWMRKQARTAGPSVEFPWGAPKSASDYSTQLLHYARKIELSSLVRIGTGKLADEEVSRTTRVAHVLAQDADFREAKKGESQSDIVDFDSLGIQILAGPKWATKEPGSSTSQRPYFDELRVTSHDSDFGAFGPLEELDLRFGLDQEPDLARLKSMAVARGRELSAKYPDSYNGVLPRLRSWRVEASSTGPIRRLHLSVERATFLTWMITNGNPKLVEDLRENHSPDDRIGAISANHVPITVALVSRDGFIVQPVRASDLAVYPDCFGSAANGNVEVEPRYAMAADIDTNGFVDFIGAALRESREELGSDIDLDRDSMRVVALIRYTDRREISAPVLVLQAKSNLNFADIVRGMRLAHPIEGAFEVGDVVRGIPTDSESCSVVVPWLLREHRAGKLTAPGLASTLLALASINGPHSVQRGLITESQPDGIPSQVRFERR